MFLYAPPSQRTADGNFPQFVLAAKPRNGQTAISALWFSAA
jgi:hypothetical protein